MIGHNQPSFEDIVQENLERGILLSIKNTIIAAIDDPRLDRRHLRVLALVIEHMNGTNGMAYPGRKKLASDSGSYGREPYTEGTIAVTIAELVQWGYLVSEKRGPQGGGRALSHYTIRKPSTEDLQAEITAWVKMQAIARIDNIGREPWKRKAADVKDGLNVKNSEVKDGVHVNPSLKVSSAVNPVVAADVYPVVLTVTSIGTSNIHTHDLFMADQVQDEPATSVKTTPEFDAFWEAYPKREGKAKAIEAFSKITTGKHKGINKTAAGKLIRGAQAYRQYVDREKIDRQYIPQPTTWLNRGGWEDECAQSQPQEKRAWWMNVEKVRSLTADDWARGIEQYCGTYWDVERMGPPPGDPACVVPEFCVRKLRLTEMFDSRGLRRS